MNPTLQQIIRNYGTTASLMPHDVAAYFLCFRCASDNRTVRNMRETIIPSLRKSQRFGAQEIAEAVAAFDAPVPGGGVRMNRQQIVPTLLQRQALASYLDAQRDAIYYAERARSLHRAVAPVAKVEAPAPAQPEPVNFCAADDDVPPALTLRQLIAAGLAWLIAMLASLWLCTEAGMRFLDAIWRLA